jgi:hypothetical protein
VPWIKLRTNLWHDPRVAYVARVVGVAPATVVGALAIVWSWADEHSTDGVLRYRAWDEINALAGVVDDPMPHGVPRLQLADALRSVGWLEIADDGSPRIPRFEEHNGATAKQRAETARRVANHRSRNGGTVTTALPREEKRREDKNTHATRVCDARARARKGGI